MVEIFQRSSERMHSRSWFASWQTSGRKTGMPICHFSMLHPMLPKTLYLLPFDGCPLALEWNYFMGVLKQQFLTPWKNKQFLTPWKTAIFSYPQLKTSKLNHFLRNIWSSDMLCHAGLCWCHINRSGVEVKVENFLQNVFSFASQQHFPS